MYAVEDPIGPENDYHILQAVRETGKVIAAWGVLGGHQNRSDAVLEPISGFDLLCLKKTKAGYPNHPLYVAADTEPTKYESSKMTVDEGLSSLEESDELSRSKPICQQRFLESGLWK